MRKVPLRIIDVPEDAGRRDTKLAYIEVFEQLAKSSDRGLTASEMDIPLALIASLQQARQNNSRFVLLEEQHWAYLNDRVKNNRWPLVSAAIQQMVVDLDNAEKIDPNAANLSVASGD